MTSEVERAIQGLRDGKSVVANCTFGFMISLQEDENKRLKIEASRVAHPIRGSEEAEHVRRVIDAWSKELQKWDAGVPASHENMTEHWCQSFAEADKLTLEHIERISKTRRGSILLVCEPCQVINFTTIGHPTIQLPPGTKMVVMSNSIELMCETWIQGQRLIVGLSRNWMQCVEKEV